MRRMIPMVFLLAGCTQVPMLPTLTPYKIDVQQGNYVNQEMVAKLKPGMTRSQVRFILGTPLVVDPFRTDRWDYVYVLKKGGELMEQRRIAVIFEDDKLKRIEGDVVAGGAGSAKDGVAPSPSTPTAAKSAPAGGVPDKPEEKKAEGSAPSSAAPAASVPAVKSEEPLQAGPR
ncbi:MAG: outer membrane protein assembly factor BamE [Betaproteobacteria bacterium]|nr:outer membrane protein assembly factor BamE [Betaproteobacteria bacterium]